MSKILTGNDTFVKHDVSNKLLSTTNYIKNDALRQEDRTLEQQRLDAIQNARSNFFPAGIPAEIKDNTRIVCWSFAWQKERLAKPPINELGYAFDPITDPTYFQSFDRALERFYSDSRIAGLGVILPGDGSIAAADMDGCLVNRNLTDFAKFQIRRLNSYTEVSPSGRGIRILCRAPGIRVSRKTAEIEFYTFGRYVTITGRHLKNTPLVLEDRLAEFGELVDEFSGEDETRIERGLLTHRCVVGSASDQGAASTDTEAWDNWIWNRMLKSKNGPDLQRIIQSGEDHLTQNDTGKFQFTGEWRVISSLAFHAKGNLEQVMRIMLSDRCRMFHRDRWSESRPGWFNKTERISFLQYEVERAIHLNVEKGFIKNG